MTSSSEPSDPDPGSKLRLGAVVWILAAQFFLAQVVVQSAWTSPFSLRQNFISDLGNTACGFYPVGSSIYVCSPWHALMNASFVALGLTILVGAALIRGAFPAGRAKVTGFVLLALAGAGLAVVGFFPENVSLATHKLGAVTQFVCGNAGILVLGIAMPRQRRILAAQSVASGALGLLATGLFASETYLGLGIGGMERLAVYPLPLCLVVIGIAFAKTASTLSR